MRHEHEYMERCIDLALGGYGHVHPNPLVGALIVKRGVIVAEGYHRTFGGPHAEIECLRRAGAGARGGTMYVNLEPCIHHGKTPPCVDAIVASGIREVVVAIKDPNPRMNGRGIRALRKAGIAVRTGSMHDAAKKLNQRFLWWQTQQTPFVGLKWAQTLDGYVADPAGRSKWITGEHARRYVHYLRSGYDALLVGAGTVRKDDPRLTVRHVDGRDPVRIVVDGRLRLTGNEKVFLQRGGRTILVTSSTALHRPGATIRRLLSRGAEVLGVGASPKIPVRRILKTLGGEGITSVMVEGGPLTISAFLDAGAYNMYHVFIRPSLLRGGVPVLSPRKDASLALLDRQQGSDVTLFEGGDLLIEGERRP